MNYNSYVGVGDNFSMNQNHFTYGHPGGSIPEDDIYMQFNAPSHNNRYSDNTRENLPIVHTQQRYGNVATFRDPETAPGGMYGFQGRVHQGVWNQGGRGDTAGPPVPYPFGAEDSAKFTNESFGHAAAAGGQMHGNSMTGTVLVHEAPGTGNRPPGAPRPLTSSPGVGRPFFRPLGGSIVQPQLQPPPTPIDILGYGFYGLPSTTQPSQPQPQPQQQPQTPARPLPVPVATATAQRFAPTGSSLAAQEYAWPPTPKAASPAVSVVPTIKPFTPKQASQVRKKLPPAQKKEEAEKQQESSKVRRVDSRPPPLRLLSGSVERVAQWLPLANKQPLLFEIFGKLSSVSPTHAGQPRVLVLHDASGTGSGAGAPSGPGIKAFFWEMDRPLAPARPGDTVRVVGRAQGPRRVQAFSARPASATEVILSRRLAFVSQHAANDISAVPAIPRPENSPVLPKTTQRK